MNSQILFALFAGFVLIGISFFTVKMYALVLKLSPLSTRISFLVFILIPFSFVASMILSRVTTLGTVPYVVMQTLSGVALYIFFGAILLGLVLLVGALTKTPISPLFAWGTLTLSCALALIGIIQARIITITPYTVSLQNAPQSWDGKTAVLVSDTHFGLVNQGGFSQKVVQKILSISPDFVLHTGDFYDGPKITTDTITASWQMLTDANIPVFYVPGNHETYGNYSAFITSIKNAGVTVLADEKILYDGVQIGGLAYRDGSDNPDAARALTDMAFENTMPSILLNHPPTSREAAAAYGIDLMVSGHTHNGQFWPMNYITKAIYGAYTYGLNTYDDALQVLTTRGVGTFGPPLRTFNQAELVLITFKTK